MNEHFDYGQVPQYFAHCFNNDCIRRRECLRHLVANHVTTDPTALTIVNPKRIPADTANCEYFKPIVVERLAWGVSHLFDQVPYATATRLRKQIIHTLGKALYYRIYRLERPLEPKHQQIIINLFRQYGIQEPPAFEKYTDSYRF